MRHVKRILLWMVLMPSFVLYNGYLVTTGYLHFVFNVPTIAWAEAGEALNDLQGKQ